MSLLDDARRMTKSPPESEGARQHECWYCETLPHAADCPWLSVPRIVAALEAVASVIAQGITPHYFNEQRETSECEVCGEEFHLRGHTPTCKWKALLIAMEGEGAPAHG